MELKWRFISFHPRNSVIEAIKSAQGNDLTTPDVDSPSNRSLWRESGCQPLSHHHFISPESPHLYTIHWVHRDESRASGGYRVAAGCFITANFPVGLGIDMAAARVRWAIGQRRILWLGWAGLGWAGLGASSDLRGRCT